MPFSSHNRDTLSGMRNDPRDAFVGPTELENGARVQSFLDTAAYRDDILCV